MNPRQLRLYLAIVRARESGFTHFANALETILREDIESTKSITITP